MERCWGIERDQASSFFVCKFFLKLLQNKNKVQKFKENITNNNNNNDKENSNKNLLNDNQNENEFNAVK